jgi:hypothetical protein
MLLFSVIILTVTLTPGAAVITWSIFADRIRGAHRLPRCPKCWYDMRGLIGSLPVTCPECGKEVASRKQLHRSRVRRWPARIGALMLVLALPAAGLIGSTLWGPVLRASPTTVLLMMYPRLPSEYEDLHVELVDRHVKGRLPVWAQDRLVERAIGQVRGLEGTGYESDWTWGWMDGRMALMTWIVMHSDREKREQIIGDYLSSDDVKYQMVGIHLAVWERSRWRLRSELPERWAEAIAQIIERNQHHGDDAYVISEGPAASPRIVELFVQRATDPQQGALQRNLAFSALETVAKRGTPPLTPHLPQLLEAVRPNSPVRNERYVFAILTEMGREGALAIRMLEQYLNDPDVEYQEKLNEVLRVLNGGRP